MGNQPLLVTSPDEVSRCCVLDSNGNRCSRPSRFWVGTQPVDDYAFVCGEHVAAVRRPGDRVERVG